MCFFMWVGGEEFCLVSILSASSQNRCALQNTTNRAHFSMTPVFLYRVGAETTPSFREDFEILSEQLS